MTIPIIDLFAGPGGLGEGFSSLDEGRTFGIVVSAEMERSAHQTLRLRSYFRRMQGSTRDLNRYYRFCNGKSDLPYDDVTDSAWQEAGEEARQLELGKPEDNEILDGILNAKLTKGKDCVLIGGPPCQAYSLVGRSRNAGKSGYEAKADHRHFLYKEYLRIIKARQPAVFVMENVKGILSSIVDGEQIFHSILRDLSVPDAENSTPNKLRYRIYSLVTDTFYEEGMDVASIDPNDFIIRSEEYGLPQARHRVILLGVRVDIARKKKVGRLNSESPNFVESVLTDIPKLRSRLSRQQDDPDLWESVVAGHFKDLSELAMKSGDKYLSDVLIRNGKNIRGSMPVGALRFSAYEESQIANLQLRKWYSDKNIHVWLNHESRSHMSSDLRRYAFASSYAALHKTSPKGHQQFSLDGLRPNHENWESGKFADRFRVQRYGRAATTITSHIAKDGHYFIHPDPTQCRSLTVREAARLQTFPDNYFFQGNRTQQFHQVGNAVPPMLAHKIAKIVKDILL